MKSVSKILQYQNINSKSELVTHTNRFDFIGKIRDSLMIMSAITQEGALNKEERGIYHKIKKQPILLTDIDYNDNALDFLVFGLDYLGNLSIDIKTLMKDEVNNVKPDTLNNLTQPLLMDCKKFEEYYK